VAEKVRAAAEMGMEMIVFSGGEPTVRKDFPRIASEAARAGLPFGLVTNARMLSYQDYFERLAALGLRYVLISLHGSDPETHNSLAGVDGFHQTLAGLERCSDAGFNITVNTVITRRNIGDLGKIAELVSNYAGAVSKFAFVEPKGAAAAAFDEIVPDISAAAAAVSRVICGEDSGRREKMFTALCDGFTPCLIHDFDRYNDDLFTHGFEYMSEVFEDGFFPVDHGLRVFAPGCERCGRRSDCPGIYKEYFIRRGDREFVPVV